MAKAASGNTVKVHYTGKLEDGTVFDTSVKRDPLEFTIGKGQIIPGFEQAVVGMEAGDRKTETIPPDKAYGPQRPELMLNVERKEIPANIPLEVGLRMEVTQSNGQAFPVTVAKIADDLVTLDANHPLAGKTLIFEIELVSVG